MPCVVLPVDPQHPEPAPIQHAAQVLRSGGLVAFPTETVYGLGADARSNDAVGRIFAAKGRPAGNPLIVHVAGVGQARDLVADWPAPADVFAEKFWPGPLTLVLNRRGGAVSEAVAGGGPTLALRVPAHPVALALLRESGLPIAAPSANRSTALSPTRAEHVVVGLGDRLDLLLDAGPTTAGLESTVLDLTTETPTLLRPGPVTLRELEAVLGAVNFEPGKVPAAGAARSPGQMARHYAPRTRLQLVAADELEKALTASGERTAVLTYGAERTLPFAVVQIVLPAEPAGYGARLYDALHRLDAAGLDCILVAIPPTGPEWLAIRDRLRRAATH